jgi:hypothetical protein
VPQEIHEHGKSHGRYIVSFYQSAGKVSPVFERKAKELFAEHGLENVEAEEFYPTNKVVAAFQSVVDEIGEDTMTEGGKEMGQAVPFPENVSDPHDALQFMDKAHADANVPRDDAPDWVERPGGGYTYRRIDNSAARFGVTDDFAYPAVLGKGGAVGAIQQFLSGSQRVSVEQVDSEDGEEVAWEFDWS